MAQIDQTKRLQDTVDQLNAPDTTTEKEPTLASELLPRGNASMLQDIQASELQNNSQSALMDYLDDTPSVFEQTLSANKDPLSIGVTKNPFDVSYSGTLASEDKLFGKMEMVQSNENQIKVTQPISSRVDIEARITQGPDGAKLKISTERLPVDISLSIEDGKLANELSVNPEELARFVQNISKSDFIDKVVEKYNIPTGKDMDPNRPTELAIRLSEQEMKAFKHHPNEKLVTNPMVEDLEARIDAMNYEPFRQGEAKTKFKVTPKVGLETSVDVGLTHTSENLRVKAEVGAKTKIFNPSEVEMRARLQTQVRLSDSARLDAEVETNLNDTTGRVMFKTKL